MKQKVLWMLLALIIGSNCVMAQKKELKTEEGGFQWYKITDKSGHEGAEDKNGRTLIPISRGYTFICYHKGNGSEGYFTVEGDEKEGVCDIRGKEIVPPIYHSVCRHGGSNGDPYYIGIESKDEKEGVCDMSGKVIFQPIYESIIYSDNNFKIEVDGEWKETEISLNHDGIASGTYNGGSYSASNSNSNRSSSYTSSKPTVKELFEEAYNTSDSEAQLKYDRYQKVLQADPKNVYGYKSLVYNNIGCLYDNLGDKKNARDYFEAALKINPNNENAKKNLKSVKRKIRAENWSNIGNALGSLGEALGRGQTGGSYNNSYQGTTGTYNGSSGGNSGNSVGSSSSGSSVYTKCTSCNGTGRCSSCKGKGYKFNSYSGHDDECPSCRGKGSCPICYGRGKL